MCYLNKLQNARCNDKDREVLKAFINCLIYKNPFQMRPSTFTAQLRTLQSCLINIVGHSYTVIRTMIVMFPVNWHLVQAVHISRSTRWSSWLRYWATSGRSRGLIRNGFIGIFDWYNPFSRTLALGMTQPLREMSTKNISWAVKAAGAYGWQP